jgi:hypothetical protein
VGFDVLVDELEALGRRVDEHEPETALGDLLVQLLEFLDDDDALVGGNEVFDLLQREREADAESQLNRNDNAPEVVSLRVYLA